jgi:hypothetical protein
VKSLAQLTVEPQVCYKVLLKSLAFWDRGNSKLIIRNQDVLFRYGTRVLKHMCIVYLSPRVVHLDSRGHVSFCMLLFIIISYSMNILLQIQFMCVSSINI